MPYEILEKKIESLTIEQQQSVFEYINFLISKNKSINSKETKRQPGGLTGTFFMSDDFDKTPDCFKDYL